MASDVSIISCAFATPLADSIFDISFVFGPITLRTNFTSSADEMNEAKISSQPFLVHIQWRQYQIL